MILSVRALAAVSRRASMHSAWRRGLATQPARDTAGSAYEPPAHTQSYLKGLLAEDDADAPWHQAPVEMVSREVQAHAPLVHESWQ
ncbi:hypothetical protein H4R18_005720 [Coemansia javaensis]|uniref:Uncharacterized protein n=1 Tax=Coemansia javaensis TaxID=2761396 RepID=A0A9W8H7P1_9FUNG|nr:hypothetical protein H4R18_005720 [Coemansia javaensis]